MDKQFEVRRVIGSLYRALTKEHWEEGPTDSEAIAEANNWFYNNFGYDFGPASEEIPKMIKKNWKPRRQLHP